MGGRLSEGLLIFTCHIARDLSSTTPPDFPGKTAVPISGKCSVLQ